MNKNLIAALSEIQNLPHDSKGYGYNYTSLPCVLNHIKPILARHNLGMMQEIANTENGDPCVRTMILDETEIVWSSEPTSCSTAGLNMKSDCQAHGAVYTYLRRYSLSALMGIASDEDIDGAPQIATERAAAKRVENIKNPKPKFNPITDMDKKRIWILAKECWGRDNAETNLRAYFASEKLPNSTSALSLQQGQEVISFLTSLKNGIVHQGEVQ